MKMLSTLIILVLWNPASSLIAYDCTDEHVNISVISLKDVAPCPDIEGGYSSVNRKVQVVQQNEIKIQPVQTCLVEVTRIITHCGMHSHSSLVAGSLANFVYPLGAEQCRDAHRYKSLHIYHRVIGNLVLNGTTTASVTLYGRIDDDGTCEGVPYTEEGHNWSKIVMTASLKIVLKDYLARVKLDTNEISLKGGIVCPYINGYCVDSSDGEAVWSYEPTVTCGQEVSSLYEGTAEIVTSAGADKIVIVEQAGKVFALALKKIIRLCGGEVWQTEHPKILVVETDNQTALQPKMKLLPNNVEMAVYVNSKLLYVEQSYKRAVNQLYVDTAHRRCLTRREIIRNRLLLAPLSSNALSAVIKNHLGYVGKMLGEVLYIIQCIPRIVQIRRVEQCYNELPITLRNDSYFMSPLTHIIQKHAIQIECNSLTPPMYQIDQEWISLTPYPVIKDKPVQLEVEAEARLPFGPIQPLGSSGLYTQEELINARRTLTFGDERDAVSNIIARRISGLQTDTQGYLTVHLFDGAEMKKLARSTLQYVWGWFTDIGMVMSGVVGIYVVWKMVKYTLDVLIHGLAIYKAAGCGIAILASLWDTLAIWVINRHHHQQASSDPLRPAARSSNLSDPSAVVVIPSAPLEPPNVVQLTRDVPCVTLPSTLQRPYDNVDRYGSQFSLSGQSVHWTGAPHR